MPEIGKIFYNESLKGIGTDCSFVFKSEDGQESIVHAHRNILSVFSSVIATNLKDLWKGNEPIEVTSFSHEVFQAVIKVIYTNEIDPLPNLKFGVDLYEATHFYLLEAAFELAREKIIVYCTTNSPKEISKLATLSFKFEDYRLHEFVRIYFTRNAEKCVNNADFLNYSPKIINMFYQINKLDADEHILYWALEKYVEKNGESMATMLKPAIATINCGSINTKDNPVLLSKEQKREIEIDNGYLNEMHSPHRRKKKHYDSSSDEDDLGIKKKFCPI